MDRDAIEQHRQAKAELDEAAAHNLDEETFARANRKVIDAEQDVPPWRR